MSDSGLIINPQWPYIGASPDGIVDCKCCTKRVFEIKCPYSHCGETIEFAASHDANFCLKTDDNGVLYLDPKHLLSSPDSNVCV